MDLALIRALAKRIFFLLALISSTCQGDGCSSDPSIVTSPSNASILQGSNHTFWCKGTGSYIEWEINGIPVYKLSEETMLEVVSLGAPAAGDCTQESMLTVHAKTVPDHNTLSTFAIQCVIKKGYHAAVVFEAYLKVHVIGGAGDMELISPESPEGPAIIQWIAPDVLTGSSSPLYYNITVRDPSNQIIAQNTTADTSFAIDSDLLVPCHSYELTLLPFQQISNRTELGLMTQTAKNYSGTPLPATDFKRNVSMEPDAPSVTIAFKVNSTSCNLQWPEKYIITVIKQGTNAIETIQSAEQTVTGMENEYTLENLSFRQKYQVSIKLKKSISSSIAEVASFSTFYVQNLTLTEQEGGHELNVHCDMAKGAEDEKCSVMMSSETRVSPWDCKTSGGRDATCKLSGLASGKYMVQGYDQELKDTPAIERAFHFTKSNGDSTNMPTTTDDATTVESSHSRFVEATDEEAVQTGVIAGIVASLITLVLIAVLVSIIVAVIMKFRSKKQNYHIRDTEVARTEEHVYSMAEENEYDEHNIPQQQDTPTEPTVVQEPTYAYAQTPTWGNAREHNLPWQQNAVTESTDIQEPAYADAQTVISATPTTNNSRHQYRELRKEWLAYLPHTTSLIHTPDGVSL